MFFNHNGLKTTSKAILICLLMMLALGITQAIMAQHQDANIASADEPDVTATSPSIMFIENMGQFAQEARFQVRGATHTLWLAEDGLWISLLSEIQAAAPRRGVNIKLSFVGANRNPRIEPFNRLEPYFNYFQGNDSSQWRSKVPAWGGVRYVDLYPGIDLEISSQNGQLVQRIVADAEADLGAVRLRAEGANKLSVNAHHLRLTTAIGDVAWPLLQLAAADGSPTALNEHTREQAKVNANLVSAPFITTSAPAMPASEKQSRLTTSSELNYSTFVGGSGDDEGFELKLDRNGNPVVTGRTSSSDFPVTSGVYDAMHNGDNDLFVFKLSADGNSLLYSTFIGGDAYDEGRDLAIDENNHIIVVGSTSSSTFPMPNNNVHDKTHNGEYDVVLLKLNSEGTSLLYSTFIGDALDDYGYSVALDNSSNIVVTGRTASSNFPTTAQAYNTEHNGSDDLFVLKLANNGQSLLYSTFVGGSEDDGRYTSLEIDLENNAIVTGITDSSDFPIEGNAYDPTFNGGSDAFLFKLASNGNDLLYSTFIGGSDYEYGHDLELDPLGNILIAGLTSSADFPTTKGSYGTKFNGDQDLFVLKLEADASTLVYSTFIGGTDDDNAADLALDANGDVLVSGWTSSSDFPSTDGAYDPTHNGSSDIFVAKLASDGKSLLNSTFVGGSNSDYNYNSLEIDNDNNVIVAGGTSSSDFPTTDDTTHHGRADVFVFSLKPNAPAPATPTPAPVPVVTLALTGDPLAENGGTATLTANLSISSQEDVTVDLGFSGTAEKGSDYTASADSITIAAGSTSASMTLTAINDEQEETDETIVVDITNVDNGVEEGTQQVSATIIDDDRMIFIDQGESIAVPMSEDGSPNPFTLTLSVTQKNISHLTWSISDEANHGTASASGTGLSKAIGYTPDANYFGADRFEVQVTDPDGNHDRITVNVDISPVADTPSVTNARTLQNTPTRDGLVITPHPDDGDSITHFQITNITGGTLYQNNGKIPIYDNDLIGFDVGQAGLTFHPTSQINGTFNIQASTNERNSGRAGDVITATIGMLDGVYIRSGVNPTDTTTTNMDEVFGAGNWRDRNYETLDMSTVFAPTTDFIFMEGGQSDASEMQAFLTDNESTIEEWVSDGGCLLLNASPTEGNGLEFGFGASLSLAQSNSGTADEAVANHPIFNEPDMAGTSFAGAGLSEGIISDNNLTPLILNSEQQPILGEKAWQTGRVAFGALNFSLFGSLEPPQHNNLHRNLIHYIANCGTNYPPIANNLTISPLTTKADGSTVVPTVVSTAGMTMTVTYDYFDANGQTEQSPRVRWRRKYKLEEQEEPGLNDELSVPADVTILEEYWCVTIRPNDGDDYGKAKETCAFIENVPNQLPEAEVTISESPTVSDTLNLSYEFIDDGSEDKDKLELRWYRNGQLQPAFNDQYQINPDELEVGEEWCAVARVHDGSEYGGVSEKQCTIINQPGGILPFIAYPRINPPEPTPSDNLELVYDYEDPDGFTRGQQNVEVRWFRDGQLQPQLNNDKTVPAQFISAGETWWATVRPSLNSTWRYSRVMRTDPVDVSANTVNSAPEATNLIINPQKPTANDDLRLTYEFTDVDNDSQGKTIIEWHKNSQRVEEYDGLRVIPAQATEVGEVWHAFVIPHDGQDYGKRVAAHSVKIAPKNTPSNSRPEAREVYLSPRKPADGDNLELNYTYHDDDPDDQQGDTLIEWFVDGEPVEERKDKHLIRDQVTYVGEEWCAKVTPHDGTVFGDPVESNCVTILEEGINTPPTVAKVHISPSVPRSSEDLVVKYKFLDADGDPEYDTKIRWYLNGRPNSEFENLTVIPAEHTSPDDLWEVEVQPGDGSTQDSESERSQEVTINTPPEVKNGRIILNNGLRLEYEYDDKNNDPEGKPQVQWYKDGVHQAHLDHQKVVRSTELAGDQTWFASIIISDEKEYSEPYTTTEVTIMPLFLPLILRMPIVIEEPTATPTNTPINTPTPTPTPTPNPDENNDTQESAYGPLEFGKDYEAYPEDLDDWYYVVITETSSLEVVLSKYKDIGLGGQLVVYEDTTNRQTTNKLARQPIANDGGYEATRTIPNDGDPDALTDLAPGRYLIRVYTEERQNNSNEYGLNVDHR